MASSPNRVADLLPTPPEPGETSHDINVLCLVKGGEHYIIMFPDAELTEALRTLGRWAANPELSLDWHNVAHLSQRAKAMAAEAK